MPSAAAARRPIVAANWKMHGDLESVAALAAAIRDALGAVSSEVVVCPPFPYLIPVAAALGKRILLGAQDVHFKSAGAHTGDVCVSMLRDLGCHYAIVGHSERRGDHGETDDVVRLKVGALIGAGLRAIVCVGETLDERESGTTETVLDRQLQGSLSGLTSDPDRLVLAYEPVWAIGTGRTATPDLAQRAHAFIRERFAVLENAEAAQRVRIQYGGSVKPDNAKELFACPDIDGGLIGGASLDAASFAAIVRAGMAGGDYS